MRRRVRGPTTGLLVAAVAGLGVAVACGSDPEGQPAADAGSGADVVVEAAADDARVVDVRDAGGPQPFEPKGLVRRGFVNVLVTPAPPPNETTLEFELYTYFIDYSGADAGVVPNGFSRVGKRASGCLRHVVDACTLVTCVLTADATFEFAPPAYVSAGEITAARSTGPVVIASPPGLPPIQYPPVSVTTTAVVPGETVAISSTGAAVPAFSGTLPLAAAVRGVAPPPGATVTWTRGTDVTIQWTGGTTGKVTISGESAGDDAIAQLDCTFDGAKASGVIPSAILAGLTGGAKFTLSPQAAAFDASVGDWYIGLYAQDQVGPPPESFTLVVE